VRGTLLTQSLTACEIGYAGSGLIQLALDRRSGLSLARRRFLALCEAPHELLTLALASFDDVPLLGELSVELIRASDQPLGLGSNCRPRLSRLPGSALAVGNVVAERDDELAEPLGVGTSLRRLPQLHPLLRHVRAGRSPSSRAFGLAL
jgi:hypothetical protein